MSRRGGRGGSSGSLLLTLSTLLLIASPSAACLRWLRTSPYESPYWLGTSYDSRFLSLTCYAIRGFRWTLKFIKVTYESWNLEMEYARCISESYGMNIPFFTPPWSRHSRAVTGTNRFVEKRYFGDELPFTQMIPQIQPTAFLKSSKNDLYLKLVSESLTRPDHNVKSLQDKSDKYTLQQLVFVNDNGADHDVFLPSQIESQQEFLRIVKSLYKILFSFFNEIEAQFSRTFSSSIVSCTRKYMTRAFWRWVDSAPFFFK